jgi:hypothetical protein
MAHAVAVFLPPSKACAAAKRVRTSSKNKEISFREWFEEIFKIET